MNSVIIEGPDGGGKTTLAEALLKELDLVYHHEGPPERGGLHDRYSALLRENSVLDRWALSEAVYGSVCRGGSLLTPLELAKLLALARRAGAVSVLCLPPLEVCEAVWEARKRSEYVTSARALREVYEAYRDTEELHDAVWDRSVTPLRAAVDRVKSLLRERRSR